VFSRIAGVIGAALVLITSTHIQAQETTPQPPDGTEKTDTQEKKEERFTGSVGEMKWKFNFDAGWGTFGFGNSLYTDVRPDPSDNLGSHWFEGFVKPAVSASIPLGKSEFYGKLSAVGERTYGPTPPLVGQSESSFKEEDVYLGWRSGTSLSSSENLLDFTVGRTPYTIGHGLLVWDGTGEGGSRGGFWTNARKAWKFATIARIKPKNHTIEGFYLDRDDLPEHLTGTRLAGINYDYAAGKNSTFGVTYFRAFAHPNVLRDRDGMNVFNARAYTAPIPNLSDLSFELEYAYETNHHLMHSTAWSAQGAYQLSKIPWKPRLSYRYAFFEGDNPKTHENEAFDPLFPGFYDWGTWWQGEIAGEYFLSNSNNISHQARLHMSPTDKLGWGVMGYWFHIDQPGSFGPGVTSTNAAFEFDSYADWKFYRHFTLSLVGAFADPHKAVQEAYNRTSHFSYGMVYLAYSF
jgi:alginate export protein